MKRLTSMRMNNEAKKRRVDHSTLAKIPSISWLLYRRRRRRTPRSAVQPSPNLPNTKTMSKFYSFTIRFTYSS